MMNWAGQIWYGVDGREGLKRLPSLIEKERARDTAGQIGTGTGHLFVFDNRYN
jgi:hypothetical protein